MFACNISLFMVFATFLPAEQNVVLLYGDVVGCVQRSVVMDDNYAIM